MAGKKTHTHYAVTLTTPFTTPDGRLTVPAGESVVAAEIVALIPAEQILDKTPAEA